MPSVDWTLDGGPEVRLGRSRGPRVMRSRRDEARRGWQANCGAARARQARHPFDETPNWSFEWWCGQDEV